MKKRDGHGHPTPQGNPALFHKKHKLSCPRKQWIGNGGFHFPSQSKQATTTFTSFHHGRGKEVAMVTSTILPQRRQDAHLHLHEAIVHNDMGNGLPWSHQPFFPRWGRMVGKFHSLCLCRTSTSLATHWERKLRQQRNLTIGTQHQPSLQHNPTA